MTTTMVHTDKVVIALLLVVGFVISRFLFAMFQVRAEKCCKIIFSECNWLMFPLVEIWPGICVSRINFCLGSSISGAVIIVMYVTTNIELSLLPAATIGSHS